jgi:hypothetical protein
MYLWEAVASCAAEKRAAVHTTSKFRIRYAPAGAETLVYEELDESAEDKGFVPVDREQAKKTWPKALWFMGDRPR